MRDPFNRFALRYLAAVVCGLALLLLHSTAQSGLPAAFVPQCPSPWELSKLAFWPLLAAWVLTGRLGRERRTLLQDLPAAVLTPLAMTAACWGLAAAGGNGAASLAVWAVLLETLHRQVVVLNRSVPGFLVNRFAQALFRESIYLIEQGVTTAADIDRAVKYAVGMRYASIGLLEYFDAVGYELESAIAKNVYPDLCGTRELQQLVLDGLATGKTGQAAGQGLYDWSQKDADDFRRRKQSPYFAGVKEWAMPDVK